MGSESQRDRMGDNASETVIREDGQVELLTVPPREQRPSLKQFGEYAPSTPHVDRHTVLNESIDNSPDRTERARRNMSEYMQPKKINSGIERKE